jgi:hypothetical protein
VLVVAILASIWRERQGGSPDPIPATIPAETGQGASHEMQEFKEEPR